MCSAGRLSHIILTDLMNLTRNFCILKFPNTRLIADKIAQSSFQVYVPDLHCNDSVPLNLFEVITDPAPSFFRRCLQYLRLICRVPYFMMWLRRHRPEKSVPLLTTICETLRSEPSFGIKKVAAQGYCWGGRHAITEARSGKFDAFVSVHPSDVQVPADLMYMAVPGCFILAKGDFMFGKGMVEKTRAFLKEQRPALRVEFREYEGVHHGFAIRGCEDNPAVLAARQVRTTMLHSHSCPILSHVCARAGEVAVVLHPCYAVLSARSATH
jgi:dienelactone hydrolase